MDLAGLIDMTYFWWVFNKVLGFVIIFLVIYVAIGAAGYLLNILVGIFRQMRG